MPTQTSSLPISELIVQEVVNSLSTVAFTAGYLNDFIVEEEQQGGNPPERDGLVIVSAADPEPQVESPVGFQRYFMTIGLCGKVIEPERSDPAAIRRRLYTVAADIRKCLQIDLHRGGYAHYTAFRDKDDLDTQSGKVIVWATVCFDTLFGNPYLQN